MVAVGRIADYATAGNGAMGQPLADMLATNLARVAGLRMVSSARMYEVLGQVASTGDTTAGAIVAAARRTGATELVDGALYDVRAGRLRLDLRRVDLASGAVLRAYTVEGPDLFALADSGTAQLVGDIGGTAPSSSLADVSTRSVTAYRLYEEGLRAFYQSDVPAAERLFQSALQEDSAFAMAQYYYSQSVTQGTRSDALSRLKRAVDLAERASDRERLLIKATWAFSNSSPATRAYAETLMVRYPAELEGYLMAGQGAILEGDYGAAHRPLMEVVARDSLGLSGKAVRCLACEALETLGVCYGQEDSGAAALRTSRLWIHLQPGSSRAWRGHAAQLARLGQVDSALAALKHADSLDPGAPSAWRYLFALQLWNNRLGEAEELAWRESQTGPVPERAEALWDLAIIYRHQGRLNEALTAASRFRQEQADVQSWGAAPSTAYMQGQVLFEQGKFRPAAALFDSISRLRIAEEDSSAAARNQIWTWTHMATALAALGDTARLAGVADTLQRLGRVSALGRDRRLHHYVRGLLFRARGQLEPAVAEFRAAMLSPNMGYSRINLELGAALVQLGRPAEAVPVLQSALRGSFEGSNLYVTHTELHDLLARAFEAAGQADSAAYHYRIVVKAWERADPQFGPRRLDAAARAARLGKTS
jgi:tetratricopeptide (TPR) repeat protein